MSDRKIPVALFAYNRPLHTARALDALAACSDRDEFEFFFFSDAARNPSAEAGVAEVRKVLADNAARFSATVIERPVNFGLSKSIVDGVSRLCGSHGCAIVLEDDLIVAPDFLRFMAEALERYEAVPEVMQVGGYTIAEPKDLDGEAFLLPVTTTWGWATWARAWNSFSWVPLGWPEARGDAKWLELFQIGGVADYVQMLEHRLEGRNDSWGILWWYAVSRARGQVVYPRLSLVRNDGFDGSGIHCGASNPLELEASAPMARLRERISFPDHLEHRAADFDLLKRALQRQTSSAKRMAGWLRPWLGKAYERVRHALG